ncbi:MAG: hypothetical protein NT150_04560 [Bacteroidetes bacterium]|nr:hypothetical protein [Bacteroidota bacterium]
MRILKHNSIKVQWLIKNALNFSKKEAVKSLSIIVVGRNDNYGGDFSLRLKTTFDWNLSLFPNAELIYIEWNPLEDKVSDCPWITERYPKAKCFVVPNEIHKTLITKKNFPILEYFAKNLGMRKASGDWFILVNADVLIGADVSFEALNKNTVYGTHYNNIQWDQQPIHKEYIEDKKNLLRFFPANSKLESVVGNFVMSHRDNWLKMTGYDERLSDVRNGVDTNGLLQLLHQQLKTSAIGNHYHLDHPESVSNGANATHGDQSRINEIAAGKNIPYKNNDSWGLNSYTFEEIQPRIWKAKI